MNDTDDLSKSDDSCDPAAEVLTRRRAIAALAGIGVGSVVFQRALAAQAEKAERVTAEMVAQAEWIAGLELSDEDRETVADDLNRALENHAALRAVELDHGVPPAITFQPHTMLPPPTDVQRGTVEPIESAAGDKPDAPEDLAFLPLVELAALVRAREVTSAELTELYLARLRRYDPRLHCVVTFTEDLARRQAEQADREIAAGRYRGPLHGIPWGAKDLIAYPGYRTTWGATPYRDRFLDDKATVARRLDAAGAVLVAKLSLGALAQGDRWFGGQTRNPWNLDEGSSGSSAGSAAAAAAGLVGFAIGSETMGSIISPSRRCGATGLRPTFGRVSRYGCMTLAWSMDKLGPLTRSVEDCALVFGAIHGYDGLDPSAIDRPFGWPLARDVRTLTVGYIPNDESERAREELRVLRELGMRLVPIALPDRFPMQAMTMVLGIEAATVFDDLTRRGITEGLNNWPRTFRRSEFVPAVEYLRANRLRTLLFREMEAAVAGVDVYVGGDDLAITNLTGHPCVALPNGFEQRNGARTPRALTFTGRMYGEAELLAVAHAYQQATGFHLERPPIARPPVPGGESESEQPAEQPVDAKN